MRFSGERLRSAREMCGCSQTELAGDVGITSGTLSDYENGNILPGIEVLIDIANRLNIAMDYFYVTEDE